MTKKLFLHLLAALGVGLLLTVLFEAISLFTFLHYLDSMPQNLDSSDAGWGGPTAIGLMLIVAFTGVPLFSVGAFFWLKKWFSKSKE